MWAIVSIVLGNRICCDPMMMMMMSVVRCSVHCCDDVGRKNIAIFFTSIYCLKCKFFCLYIDFFLYVLHIGYSLVTYILHSISTWFLNINHWHLGFLLDMLSICHHHLLLAQNSIRNVLYCSICHPRMKSREWEREK